MTTRTVSAVLALVALAQTGLIQAQPYPIKPIRFVVPYPAGAIADNVGRIIGQALSQRLKQPVVVDNKAGADGAIGTMAVVKAAPDGYSLLVGAPAAILGVH